MSRHIKAAIAVAAAAIALFAAVGTASAARLSMTESRFLAGWSSMSFAIAETTVRCPAIIEGSFHARSFSKTSGTLVGYVRLAYVPSEQCTGGGVTVNEETLPWHVRYESFTGTLPSITGVRFQIIGATLRGEILGIRCQYITSATEPLVIRAGVTSGAMRELEPLRERTIRGTGGICPNAALSGASATAESNPITIRLI